MFGGLGTPSDISSSVANPALSLPSGGSKGQKAHSLLFGPEDQIVKMEARSGIEPLYRSFADSCLTTWLPRQKKST